MRKTGIEKLAYRRDQREGIESVPQDCGGNLTDVGTLYSLVGLIANWLEFVKKKLHLHESIGATHPEGCSALTCCFPKGSVASFLLETKMAVL